MSIVVDFAAAGVDRVDTSLGAAGPLDDDLLGDHPLPRTRGEKDIRRTKDRDTKRGKQGERHVTDTQRERRNTEGQIVRERERGRDGGR